MEFIIAIAIGALGVAIYLIRKRTKSTAERPVTFACPRCGEKHCHCEQQG